MLTSIPHSISEVHFSLNIAHHPLYHFHYRRLFSTQKWIFIPYRLFLCFYSYSIFSIQLALIYVLLHTAKVITSTNHILASFPH